VFVTGKGWSDYATERQQHERRHDAADELPGWEDGVPWDASTPTCPKCGTAALWESLADKMHCLACDPIAVDAAANVRQLRYRAAPSKLSKL
jgi:hypothetical protein